MTNVSLQDPHLHRLSSGIGQMLPSRPVQSTFDPSASKHVCFFRSGDHKFSGHQMVINSRNFKTFDALLDALSEKVPLPFGVRTISTPRGTHFVKELDDLHDGSSYVCSDQKQVKPINLDKINRQQVPWNAVQPLSGKRQRGQPLGQSGRRTDATNRQAKDNERIAIRTPKKLLVIKNRDPATKCTVVLQKKNTPTFDALLDHLSQILQFPVLKLYSTDGRRVDGLAALILCCGIIVAAGNEPFRSEIYSINKTSHTPYMDATESPLLQARAQINNKSFFNGRASRKFSSSSEWYIVDQINKSQNGHHHSGTTEMNVNQHQRSVDTETCQSAKTDGDRHAYAVPRDDDIEKSFQINQDGSMTVEMKVHLTIKEEEILHWTTMLSRSNLIQKAVCVAVSESRRCSPDSNNAIAKDSSDVSEVETKEENQPSARRRGVGFNDEGVYDSYTSTTLTKTTFNRTPTPGPRRVKKTTSVESFQVLTDLGVQESILGQYSFTERTADGDTTEGYCVIRQSSSSSKETSPNLQKIASAGPNNSSNSSSGVANVLQIQNNGVEVTNTVTHVYESQGCYGSYFANDEYSTDGIPSYGCGPNAEMKVYPNDSGQLSPTNGCDLDCTWRSPTPCQHEQQDKVLSSLPQPTSPTQEMTNNLSKESAAVSQTHSSYKVVDTVKKSYTRKVEKEKVIKTKQKNLMSTSSLDNKLNKNIKSKYASMNKFGNVHVGKQNSSRSAKNVQEKKAVEKLDWMGQTSLNTKNMKKTLTKKRLNTNSSIPSGNGHNLNTPEMAVGRPLIKKNMPDILLLQKSLLTKDKSSAKKRTTSSMQSSELTESVSMNASSCDSQHYIENVLEKVNPDLVPYKEKVGADKSEPRTNVVFQIGDDSESEEKNKCQINPDDWPLQYDKVQHCASCWPVCSEGPETAVPHNDQKESNNLSCRAKIKDVVQKICSSIQCIRRTSEQKKTCNLEMSSSRPDFASQVASVFSSSSKAFTTFLSVVALQDCLEVFTRGGGSGAGSTSEALLLLECLQKISTIEDEDEQSAKLTLLQSKSSSELNARWKNYQILRESLDLSSLSSKMFQDVLSERGGAFQHQCLVIDEVMEESSMPKDLRAEIWSTLQFQFISDVEHVEHKQVLPEEDLQQLGKKCSDETEHWPESESEDVYSHTRESYGVYKRHHMHSEHAQIMEPEFQKTELNVKESEDSQHLEGKEREDDGGDDALRQVSTEKEQAEEVEEDVTSLKESVDGDTTLMGNDSKENETSEREEGKEEKARKNDEEKHDEEMKWEKENREDGGQKTEDEKINLDKKSYAKESDEEDARKEEEKDREGSIEETGKNYNVEEGYIYEVEEEGADEEMEEVTKESGDGEEEEVVVVKDKMAVGENEKGEKFREAEDYRNVVKEKENCLGEEKIEEGWILSKNISKVLTIRSEENQESMADTGRRILHSDSSNTYCLEDPCEDNKTTETDEGGELEVRRNLPHAVEISQELLDFVNSVLQSSSLVFTCDAWGNMRIESVPKRCAIPKSREDSLYGLKCLKSPSTSDLSDYRPETSDSSGSNPQESVDISTESGEETSPRHSSESKRSVCMTNGGINVEMAQIKESATCNSELWQRFQLKSENSFSSFDSEFSREHLSGFSSETSLKPDVEPVTEAVQCSYFSPQKDSDGGVLIDKGRWLLKENHLIRKSPPVSMGMYGHLDSVSVDTGQDNTSEDYPYHYIAHHNPFETVSSSELEEIARPQTPKCTYYNMPHGSDSDPFLDDISDRIDVNSAKGQGFRVSPASDASKTWARKTNSLSSFASVDFKLPDRKVHPEGESSAMAQASRLPGAEERVLQVQDSVDGAYWRCGQYCSIL
ncbi:oxygen-regulated protein 1 [Thalassophryne amazonica]|uniref:oxygen-regulated protein 1 n=1 Tax=Thalassophryne amazonica TaxID=390379 RepID=UPI001471F3EA|nr:oxygen-regulated protein 1 [Thalassophryne amazonica]